MSPEELTNLISTLSPEDQAEVGAFILILKGASAKGIDFRARLHEFVRKHPEFLHLLAQ
ncbi:MAG: hypothetical protein WB543_03455 [Candidatus Acidiferrum sp.]